MLYLISQNQKRSVKHQFPAHRTIMSDEALIKTQAERRRAGNAQTGKIELKLFRL
jgi:hypothetical protein